MACTTISDCTIHNGASDAHCRAVESIAKALSEMAIAAQELAKAIHMPDGMEGIHLEGDCITNNDNSTNHVTNNPMDIGGVDDDDYPEDDEVKREAPKEPGPWSGEKLADAEEDKKED